MHAHAHQGAVLFLHRRLSEGSRRCNREHRPICSSWVPRSRTGLTGPEDMAQRCWKRNGVVVSHCACNVQLRGRCALDAYHSRVYKLHLPRGTYSGDILRRKHENSTTRSRERQDRVLRKRDRKLLPRRVGRELFSWHIGDPHSKPPAQAISAPISSVA